jgi:predicted thioesterase
MSHHNEPQSGASSALEFHVSQADTAIALGSGDLPVLATPRVIAWCESACVQALDLADTKTSVGTRVEFEHVSASAVGAAISVKAVVSYVDGRLVRFDVVAEQIADRATDISVGDPANPVRRIAHGSMTRVIVDRERFMARL